MALRIPSEELERLKAEVSVEHLVGASGVELKEVAGKDLLRALSVPRGPGGILGSDIGEEPVALL